MQESGIYNDKRIKRGENLIKCNITFDGGLKTGKHDWKKEMDVISFTFSSQIKGLSSNSLSIHSRNWSRHWLCSSFSYVLRRFFKCSVKSKSSESGLLSLMSLLAVAWSKKSIHVQRVNLFLTAPHSMTNKNSRLVISWCS